MGPAWVRLPHKVQKSGERALGIESNWPNLTLNRGLKKNKIYTENNMKPPRRFNLQRYYMSLFVISGSCALQKDDTWQTLYNTSLR
jgi:hypothetical protein